VIVYLDSSAAIPLIRAEESTPKVREYLQDLRIDQHYLISGRIIETEMRRAATRLDIDQSEVSSVLRGIEIIEITPAIFRAAGQTQPQHLRSLDALHLATALAANASVMITLDQRLIEACSEVGLSVLDINIPREYVRP
jgi:predicted nucleic acid-binding protein